MLVSPWIERGDLASFVNPEKSEKVEGVNFVSVLDIAMGESSECSGLRFSDDTDSPWP